MNSTKLLFIDSKLENYHHLIPQVDSNTKVVILEPDHDGIDQIATHLNEYHQVDIVQIISHGAKGTLYLGNTILNLDNIHLYAESIQQWSKCLSAEAEILIYGCQVASGKEGREFVRQLHQLTGANIAASETLTGNLSKGGNWNLEVIFGQVKSALANTPTAWASYPGVLANIVVDTTEDVVDDGDGVTSLREAIIQANTTPEDDTIQLSGGETYNLTISGRGENAAATGDLDILAGGGQITVISEGEEKATIDAGGETGISDRVFHILEDGFLELDNVEVTGGVVSGAFNALGGGIYNEGTVSINNSTISGNSVTNDRNSIDNIRTPSLTFPPEIIYGGGINNSGTATINNSTISENSAGSDGGGINNSGTVTINNSTISDNSAGSDGGGIRNSFSGTATINNSTISENSANDGGGIDNRNTASINNSSISGNSAADDGGGIYNGFSGTATINNSSISGNSAADDGGGIYNRSTTTINNSSITGNSADSGGGGIHNSFSGMASINNSTISGNSANGSGGIENSGTASINNSGILGNLADFGGGGIDNNFSGTVTIANSNISVNSADFGGGIQNLGTATINNSSITDNSADFRGGGINNSGIASISDSTISGNSAANNGGGIYNQGRAGISNSTISGNFADFGGGIGNLDLGRASISNSTISDNSAGFGGGIDNDGIAITVTSSIVYGNTNSDVDLRPYSSFISGNHNLIGTGNAINNFNRDRDQIGVTNPLLGDLADNGGSTLTHLPLPNSPAIDAGSNPNAFTTDQRGQPRLFGEAVDIGAVELQPIQEIIGTPSSDILNGTSRRDRIFGLTGNDLISGLDSSDVLFGNEDNDTLNGDAGNDVISGGQDDDLILGNTGEDLLRGDRGSDSIFGQEGNDVAFGGKDSDSIDGGLGDDSISGDLGNDTLIGGEGIDTLTGGNDVDIFQLAVGEGLDIITDFTDGIDLIQLPDFLSFNDLEIRQTDGSTAITLAINGEELALLNNVPASLITEVDFII